MGYRQAMQRAAVLLLVAAPPAVQARSPNPLPGRAAVLDALAACRAEKDDARRLSCYDSQAGQLLDAEQKHDIVVVDRAQVREAKRTLFGLNLPTLAIFGHGAARGDRDEEEIKRIETTLDGAIRGGDGRWLFTLADGAHWRQIDDYELYRNPKSGDKVVVMRAALGSFKLSVSNGPAVRVRREN